MLLAGASVLVLVMGGCGGSEGVSTEEEAATTSVAAALDSIDAVDTVLDETVLSSSSGSLAPLAETTTIPDSSFPEGESTPTDEGRTDELCGNVNKTQMEDGSEHYSLNCGEGQGNVDVIVWTQVSTTSITHTVSVSFENVERANVVITGTANLSVVIDLQDHSMSMTKTFSFDVYRIDENITLNVDCELSVDVEAGPETQEKAATVSGSCTVVNEAAGLEMEIEFENVQQREGCEHPTAGACTVEIKHEGEMESETKQAEASQSQETEVSYELNFSEESCNSGRVMLKDRSTEHEKEVELECSM